LAYNREHYQLSGVNWRQRFKRAAGNLLEDNELFTGYESSQNDGNESSTKVLSTKRMKILFSPLFSHD
jgi:hypothetical protein